MIHEGINFAWEEMIFVEKKWMPCHDAGNLAEAEDGCDNEQNL